MRVSHIASALAAMLRLFSYAFLVPIVVAFAYEPRDLLVSGIAIPSSVIGFLGGFFLLNALAIPVKIATRAAEEEDMSEREGYLTAALGWVLMPLFGMIPFLLDDVFASPLDAYFEAMSGATTTGFSVLPLGPEAIAPSLNFWRVQLNWLGGIGIVILSIALLSKLTHGGLQLFQAESSIHANKRLRPKLADTARALLAVYAQVSLVLFLLVLAAMKSTGLDWKTSIFEALLLMMAGFATGGFSSHAASIGAFASVWVELSLIVTMVVGATNFQVLVLLRRGQVRQALANGELRFFLAVLALGVLAVTAVLASNGYGLWAALRDGAFATTSLTTTTGFNTVDYSVWPVAANLLLLALLFVGGSSGSTGGALKVFRVMVLGKMVLRELRRLIHPRAVMSVRFAGRALNETALAATSAFAFSYIALWILGMVAIAVTEPAATALEAAGASAASLGNVGNAFGIFGPAGSVAAVEPATKIVMIVLMWFGRLEIFTAFLLFYPKSWRN